MHPEPEQRTAARRLAMDLLARREHSRLELARKLASRGFAPALVETVLDDLREDGLQCDERFAASFVNSRVGQGKGPLKVLAELRERGLDETHARQALDDSGADWHALARAALGKRFGAEGPADFKARARRMRFLAQRGFSREQAHRAVEENCKVTRSGAGEEL